MRRFSFFAAAFAVAASLVACNEKGNGGEPTLTVDFESAELLNQTGNYSPRYDNILWGADSAEENSSGDNVYEGIIYDEDGASFGSYYNDNASGEYPGDYWGGFAVSSSADLRDMGLDYSSQFGVYAPSASKFAIGYDTSYAGSGVEYDKPTILFDAPCRIATARIANANKTYHYCAANPKGASGEKDILFELVATGYHGSAEAGTVKITLARGTEVLADWREVSFASLGEVDKVVFSFESNDTNEWGNLVPMFFCIDDLKIIDN